jgi:hypothetical protein
MVLRFCLGSAQVRSPSAQVKAAVAHVRKLKRNQRQGKLILSLGVSDWLNVVKGLKRTNKLLVCEKLTFH